mgnify:FL=1
MWMIDLMSEEKMAIWTWKITEEKRRDLFLFFSDWKKKNEETEHVQKTKHTLLFEK